MPNLSGLRYTHALKCHAAICWDGHIFRLMNILHIANLGLGGGIIFKNWLMGDYSRSVRWIVQVIIDPPLTYTSIGV